MGGGSSGGGSQVDSFSDATLDVSLSVTPDPVCLDERPLPTTRVQHRTAALPGFSPAGPVASQVTSAHVTSPLPDSGFGDMPASYSPGQIKGWFVPYVHPSPTPLRGSPTHLTPLTVHIPSQHASSVVRHLHY